MKHSERGKRKTGVTSREGGAGRVRGEELCVLRSFSKGSLGKPGKRP